MRNLYLRAHRASSLAPQHQATIREYQEHTDSYARALSAATRENRRVEDQNRKHLLTQKNLVEQIGSRKHEIQTVLRASKEDVLKMVEKVFADMEKELLQQLEKEKEKTGLHAEEYLEQLYLEINKKSLELYQKAQELSSFKYPEMIRTINSEVLEKNRLFLDRIDKEINENELFKMEVIYQPNALK